MRPFRALRARKAEAAAADRAAALPEGSEWRRAAVQLSTRLGGYPGDRVLVFAPPERDPAPAIAHRLPRIRLLRVDDEIAGAAVRGEAAPERDTGTTASPQPVPTARMSLEHPAVQMESIDACVVVLAVPLLDAKRHAAFVETWAPTLAPFGKWLELVSVENPKDERLQQAESGLKQAGFEKVRSLRLAFGRRGRALYLVTGRWPGVDDDDDHYEEDDEDED